MKKTNQCANLRAIGDLRVEEREIPTPKEDEVLVEIKACGICGSDLGRVFTSGTYHFPTVIGHEFSGRVVEDKTGEMTGKRVAVFPLLPCFACESCQTQSYATCKNYDYYGSRRDGGMAKYLAVKRFNLTPLPDGVSYEAGAMCEPVSVARHAVRKLGIETGDSLLISGAGPIGIIAGFWARSMGASVVYYVDIDESKLAFAKRMGFHAYEDGVTVDCILEGTGASEALEVCLGAVRPFGRGVLMGNPLREMTLSQKGYWQILRKELSLKGTWNSSYGEMENDWRESLAAMAKGDIDILPLISHRYPLKDVMTAFMMMRDKKESYHKVMLVMSEEEAQE